jgi:hypothetical protein
MNELEAAKSGQFFVYRIDSIDGTAVYIGKGGGNRDRYWKRKNPAVMAMGVAGLLCKPIRVFDGTEEQCYAEESRLISLYGRKDLGLGELLNLTNGGAGAKNPNAEGRAKRDERCRGQKRSAEFCASQRDRGLNRKHSYETRAKLSARVITPQWRERISAAKRGKKHTAEARANMSEAQKGRVRSPEECESIRKAKLGRKRAPFSEEWRAKLSASALAHHAAKRAASTRIGTPT